MFPGIPCSNACLKCPESNGELMGIYILQNGRGNNGDMGLSDLDTSVSYSQYVICFIQ